MLNISTFFSDMFSLPNAGIGASSVNASINLEETADVIERMLYAIHSSQYAPLVLEASSLRQLHAAVKVHDKFDIETNRFQAETAFKWALAEDPWAGLAYASHDNDLEVGRFAIQYLQLHDLNHNDIWEVLSDVKPSWQIALAKLILPKVKIEILNRYDDDEEDPGSGIEWFGASSTQSRVNMRELAKNFNPK
jgi:non-ribosomal peptide synthetase component F